MLQSVRYAVEELDPPTPKQQHRYMEELGAVEERAVPFTDIMALFAVHYSEKGSVRSKFTEPSSVVNLVEITNGPIRQSLFEGRPLRFDCGGILQTSSLGDCYTVTEVRRRLAVPFTGFIEPWIRFSSEARYALQADNTLDYELTSAAYRPPAEWSTTPLPPASPSPPREEEIPVPPLPLDVTQRRQVEGEWCQRVVEHFHRLVVRESHIHIHNPSQTFTLDCKLGVLRDEPDQCYLLGSQAIIKPLFWHEFGLVSSSS